MREEVKIIEFLRTGRFGRVALNDSFQRVKEILGRARWRTQPRGGKASKRNPLQRV